MSQNLPSNYSQSELFDDFIQQNRHVLHQIHRLLISTTQPSVVTAVCDADADGHAAAALLERYLTVRAALDTSAKLSTLNKIAVLHGKAFASLKWLEAVKDPGPLVILDHEVTKELLGTLAATGRDIVVIDHHLGSSVDLGVYDNVFVLQDSRWSTTALTDGLLLDALRRRFLPGDVRSAASVKLARIVNHYDTWLFGQDDDEDQEVKAFFSSFRRGEEAHVNWTTLADRLGALETQLALGHSRHNAVLEEITAVTTESVRTVATPHYAADASPIKTALVFHSNHIDEIGERLLKSELRFGMVAMIRTKETKDGGYRVSLRSRKLDKSPINTVLVLSAWASQYQQKTSRVCSYGGHVSASGIELDLPAFLDFVQYLDSASVDK